MAETNAGLNGAGRWLTLVVQLSVTAQPQAQIDLLAAAERGINRALEAWNPQGRSHRGDGTGATCVSPGYIAHSDRSI